MRKNVLCDMFFPMLAKIAKILLVMVILSIAGVVIAASESHRHASVSARLVSDDCSLRFSISQAATADDELFDRVGAGMQKIDRNKQSLYQKHRLVSVNKLRSLTSLQDQYRFSLRQGVFSYETASFLCFRCDDFNRVLSGLSPPYWS